MAIKFDDQKSWDPAAEQLVGMLWSWNEQLRTRVMRDIPLGDESDGPPRYAELSATRLLGKYQWAACVEALIGFVVNHVEASEVGDFSALARSRNGKGPCHVELSWRAYQRVGQATLKRLGYEIVEDAAVRNFPASPWRELVLKGLRTSSYGPPRKQFRIADLPAIEQGGNEAEVGPRGEKKIEEFAAIKKRLAKFPGMAELCTKSDRTLRRYFEKAGIDLRGLMQGHTLRISPSQMKVMAPKIAKAYGVRQRKRRQTGIKE